jgi:GNAT superfamily N-acetyltransferase
MQFRIGEEHDGTSAVEAEVRRGIRAADPKELGARDYKPLCIAMRDTEDALRGGLYGATMWGWLMIDGLWIAADLRGRGLGARLLAAGEAVAAERGCRGAWLGTFDFQARSFYERQGYRVCGELAGFPEGHTHFHLAKRLERALPTSAI